MVDKLSVLSRLGYAFNRCNVLSFCLSHFKWSALNIYWETKILLPFYPLALANLYCLCANAFQTPRDFSVDEFPFVSTTRRHESFAKFNLSTERTSFLHPARCKHFKNVNTSLCWILPSIPSFSFPIVACCTGRWCNERYCCQNLFAVNWAKAIVP